MALIALGGEPLPNSTAASTVSWAEGSDLMNPMQPAERSSRNERKSCFREFGGRYRTDEIPAITVPPALAATNAIALSIFLTVPPKGGTSVRDTPTGRPLECKRQADGMVSSAWDGSLVGEN
jgi:hypothetical protein